jgi:hypothetical protein
MVFKVFTGVALQQGMLDNQVHGSVVADKENCPAAFPSIIIFNSGSAEIEIKVIAVIIYSPSTAAAGSPRTLGISTIANRFVMVGKEKMRAGPAPQNKFHQYVV